MITKEHLDVEVEVEEEEEEEEEEDEAEAEAPAYPSKKSSQNQEGTPGEAAQLGNSVLFLVETRAEFDDLKEMMKRFES
ncbi:unnamed protein product, partial [Mesorhabditis belari]|uniref:Uncharacterized protein n=1 Tax=Mesorhabditis belari TaxID=2138241 RepID=A0AAF3EHV4_9BILA